MPAPDVRRALLVSLAFGGAAYANVDVNVADEYAKRSVEGIRPAAAKRIC